jgi:urea carboxylase
MSTQRPAPPGRAFDTLLVANRGEIACRIIRTAMRIGLRTVAVFSDPDRGAPHVHLADAAVHIGPAPPRESYLLAERILEAARETGAEAIHPGYGLLSENAEFARATQAAGLQWVGPTAEQLELFGAKDRARELARTAGVPLTVGSDVLADLDAAQAAAERIGYPVMLKATGGGGGIGMARCRGPYELAEAFESVARLATASFAVAGVYLERLVVAARHVEVQVFGDGEGRILTLGDRDCTLQRRNQKVIEEAPAPALGDRVRDELADAAARLTSMVSYRSAGTVEFIYDPEREQASFLEVNARLQVEHTVTEEVHGIDLVEWMLRLAQGDASMFDGPAPRAGATGTHHAVQARVYAEDPNAGHQPSAGVLTAVELPQEGLRVDGWIEPGSEITTAYDPLLAKVIAGGATREEALSRLANGLERSRIAGVRTNLGLLRTALRAPVVRASRHDTATLGALKDAEPRIDVIRAGTLTTVQDWPGRQGLWHVGVPPSGPMDDRSFRLGNRALGNPEGAPGLECTLIGPVLRFSASSRVCVCGADAQITIDGVAAPRWTPLTVPAGAVLEVGPADGRGLRVYVLVQGGLDVPAYLGSAATFPLGGFGGHGGRALRPGDVLVPGRAVAGTRGPVPVGERPELTHTWEIVVLEGPHAAPEFFTHDDIDTFYATDWEVHFNSARTGVRLIGPRPEWAREDGGEAGLHPSNIHDTAYSVGSVDYTGDLPIVLGPDGPSLGGFVCPATVVTAERWKLGQLRPGDTVRFARVSEPEAAALRGRWTPFGFGDDPVDRDHGILGRLEAIDDRPEVTYRRSGDDNLLVEYGDMTLDLGLRMRVHALAERIAAETRAGVIDLTPGIRSLQVHVDPDAMSVRRALDLVRTIECELPATHELAVPSRTVHLPLSWDDPATRLAIERYMAGVRPDAPWCPWNIEFIRRVNGLESVANVREIVYAADYIVLGLGDVYLGAPVATPLDPRHRLVTTKYNPARTWTPENAVGIGGAYLCIYGMEGPGGYQFVGRTVQVWSRYRSGGPFEPGSPWLLRFFDKIRWHPVSAEELLEQRADLAAGRLELEIEQGSFTLAEHVSFLEREADGIAAFRGRQAAAFAAERDAWARSGEFDARPEPVPAQASNGSVAVPDGAVLVEAPLSASVWQVDVRPGDAVTAGQRLLTLEAMKMETALESPIDGEVLEVLVGSGDQVVSGSGLVVVGESLRDSLGGSLREPPGGVR